MLATVMQAFANDLAQVPEQIETYLRAQDTQGAARFLHTQKGLAATVGARHLSEVARNFESAVKSAAGGDEIADSLVQMRAAVTALHAPLNAALAQLASPPARESRAAGSPQGVDRERLKHDLLALAEQLRNSDMVALEVHALLQKTTGAQLGDALLPLGDAMASLHFEEALKACQALIQTHCNAA